MCKHGTFHFTTYEAAAIWLVRDHTREETVSWGDKIDEFHWADEPREVLVCEEGWTPGFHPIQPVARFEIVTNELAKSIKEFDEAMRRISERISKTSWEKGAK